MSSKLVFELSISKSRFPLIMTSVRIFDKRSLDVALLLVRSKGLGLWSKSTYMLSINATRFSEVSADHIPGEHSIVLQGNDALFAWPLFKKGMNKRWELNPVVLTLVEMAHSS
jgi:hypothetical protein